MYGVNLYDEYSLIHITSGCEKRTITSVQYCYDTGDIMMSVMIHYTTMLLYGELLACKHSHIPTHSRTHAYIHTYIHTHSQTSHT